MHIVSDTNPISQIGNYFLLGYKSVDRIQVAQERVHCQALVNAVMNLSDL